MGQFNAMPNISEDDLRVEIRKEYTNVALNPHKGYQFHTGRDALGIIGYDESLLEGLAIKKQKRLSSV